MTEDRISKKDSEKQVLIQKVKERLKWYTFEASEEEFDAGEVEALTELLMAMQGNAAGDFDVEDSWRRFPEHCRTREELERKGAVFADTAAPFADNGGKKNEEAAKPERADTGEEFSEKPIKGSAAGDRLRPFGRGHKGAVGIAACIFAAVVLLGGTGVYAEKGGGFFHWLKSGKDNIELITSPESALNEGMNEAEVYYSVGEVPEEYQGYVWCPEEGMREWILDEVNVLTLNNDVRLKSLYKDNNNLHLGFEVTIYHNKITNWNLTLTGGELILEETIDDNKFFIYKSCVDKEVEYAICFFYNNVQYIVNGNLSLEDLQKISKSYYKFIKNII